MNHLRQIVLAVHNYESSHEQFPPGSVNATGPIRNLPQGYHISWLARILRHLEEPAVYRSIDFSLGAYDPKNDAARQQVLEVLHCPSIGMALPISDYAACHHDREAPIDEDDSGVFFLNSRVTYDDLEDGAKHTLFIGEKLGDPTYDLGWLSGTPATLRNTGPPLVTGFDWRVAQNVPPWVAASGSDWGFVYGEAEFTEEERSLAEGAPARYQIASEDANEPPAAMELAVDATAAEEMPTTPDPETNEEAAVDPSGSPSGERKPASSPRPRRDSANGAGGNGALGGDPSQPLAVGGFGGFHPGGVMFAFGDGSVEFVAEHVSQVVLRRLAHRRDGQMVSAADR